MSKFYGRDRRGEVDWDINNNFDDLFPENEWTKVYGMDNIIDILLMDFNGNFFSISPSHFNGNTMMSRDKARTASIRYIPSRRFRDRDVLGMPHDSTGDNGFANILSTTNGAMSATMWSDSKNLGDRIFNSSVNEGAQYYEDIKNNYPNSVHPKPTDDDAGWRNNEFSFLYNNVDAVGRANQRGYKLFVPDDWLNWLNWIVRETPNACNGSDNDRACYREYLMVMYLDARNAALHTGCFNPNFKMKSTVIQRLFTSDRLTNKNIMLEMGNSSCKDPIPSYSQWGRGDHYSGDVLFSPNTQFKLILQTDGNMCLYRLDDNGPSKSSGNNVWSSGTYLKEFQVNANNYTYTVKLTRPRLSIQSDGNIVIYSREGNAMWSSGSSGGDVHLAINNGGTLFVYDGRLDGPIKDITGGLDRNTLTYVGAIMAAACDVGDYRNTGGVDISKAKLEYCKQGNNMITEAKCVIFGAALNDKIDNAAGDIKNEADAYVKGICTDDKIKNADDNTRKFCSCFVPYDETTKAIIQTGQVPLSCLNSCTGYQTKAMLASKPCNLNVNICMQDLNMVNLLKASGIQMTCNQTNDNRKTDTSTGVATDGTPAAPCTLTDFQWKVGTYHATDVKLNSPNGKYYLTFQTDGNLVGYKTDDKSVTFSAGTYGNTDVLLQIDVKGNVAIYKSDGTQIWQTNTTGDNVNLAIDNNGVPFVFSDNNSSKIIWKQPANASIDFACASNATTTKATTTSTTPSSTGSPLKDTTSSGSSTTPASGGSTTPAASGGSTPAASGGSTPAASGTTSAGVNVPMIIGIVIAIIFIGAIVTWAVKRKGTGMPFNLNMPFGQQPQQPPYMPPIMQPPQQPPYMQPPQQPPYMQPPQQPPYMQPPQQPPYMQPPTYGPQPQYASL